MPAAKYNWKDWLSRPRTVLVRGVDYHCSQSTMVQLLRNAASKRRVSVRLCEDETCQAIQVEVLSVEGPRSNKAAVAG
jgi:hypothetical protein